MEIIIGLALVVFIGTISYFVRRPKSKPKPATPLPRGTAVALNNQGAIVKAADGRVIGVVKEPAFRYTPAPDPVFDIPPSSYEIVPAKIEIPLTFQTIRTPDPDPSPPPPPEPEPTRYYDTHVDHSSGSSCDYGGSYSSSSCADSGSSDGGGSCGGSD